MMKAITVLLCCVYFCNTGWGAQQPNLQAAKDSTQKLFAYHFKILDSAARKSKLDTIGGFTASVWFMEKHTKIEPGTEGSFTGRWGFTRVALKQWHEWYDKKYKRTSGVRPQ